MNKKIVMATVVLIVLQLLAVLGSGVRLVLAINTGSISREPSGSSCTKCTSSMINGKISYPTFAPIPSDPSFGTLWWAGSVYPQSLANQNAMSICATIDVPNSTPSSEEFYYILLSCYDSNGSYDQLGFCADYGIWGLAYSYTVGNPANTGNYRWDADAMNLSQGTTYTFNITVENTIAYFVAYQGSTEVWSEANYTGGNYLILANQDPYWGSGSEGYTSYEEVHNTTTEGGAPSFNFYFYHQYWVATNGSSYASTWTSFTVAQYGYSVPNGVEIVIDGDSVMIGNPGIPLFYPVDVAVTSVDPLPPHYPIFQDYRGGMRLDGQSISMSYIVTVNRTDSDTSFSLLYIEYGLNRTNVNNASDCRNIGTANALLTVGESCNYTFVWNETDTLNPGNYSITGYANILNANAFDTNPADNQLTNDTVQAEELIGDLNGDGVVDIFDAIIFSDAFGSKPGDPNWNPYADFNGDGVIDIYDAITFASHFGQSLGGNGIEGMEQNGGGVQPDTGGVQPDTGGGSSVTVDPNQISVFKGEVFNVSVDVSSVTDLLGWEFQLYWNNSVLNCTNVAVETPSVWQGNTLTVGPGLQENYNATTALYWQAQAGTYPASSFNGSMTIVTLTFQALQPGSTSLTLADVKLGNSTAQPIACSVSSGSVTVNLSPVLTIYASNGGTTNPASGQYSENYGTNVTVTATANSGDTFEYWILDGNDISNNPITVNMTANHSLTPYFYVPPPGGCVLSGTLITMADGKTVPVQKVKPGDSIMGYDVQTGTFVTETVTSNNCTTVDEVLSINNGLLYVTPTEQPIYTDHGWVSNPQDLMIGWKIYNPTTNTWTTVQSITTVEGNFRVYDLQATQPNTFIGNGILLDRKT
jgi:hypothetical protein